MLIEGRDQHGTRRPTLLIVGAFPEPQKQIFGGLVSSCAALLRSSLPEKLDLLLIDTTQSVVPYPPWFVRLGSAFGRAWRIVAALVASRPDAVLIFASEGAGALEKALYAAIAHALGTPSMLFLRAGGFMEQCRRSRMFALVARLLVRRAAALPCQGSSWQRFYQDEFGIRKDLCPVIQNWTATGELIELGAKRRYARSESVTILYVGWVERTKGILDLLEAYRMARPRAPCPLSLVVVGEGSASGTARALVERHGLQRDVLFKGWLTGEALLREYAAASLFVLPSYAEGLPNAMIEAMAAGLPVVVTSVGCIPDVVRDDEHGRYVPVGEPESLAEVLVELANSPALRERLGRCAGVAARSMFDVETASAQLTELVHRLSTRHLRRKNLR